MPREVKKIGEATGAALLARWGEGISFPRLAREFGLSTATVWTYCEARSGDPGGLTRAERARRSRAERARRKARRAGLATARRVARKADRNAAIRRLWSEGWMGVDLAAQFGLSKATVSGIVAGLPREPRAFGPEDARPAAIPLRAPMPAVAGPPRAAAPAMPPPPAVPVDPRDAIDRFVRPNRGSGNANAKLDEAKVARIKRLRIEGWTTNRLAREFGVGSNTIAYITSGQTWTHVRPAPPNGRNS